MQIVCGNLRVWREGEMEHTGNDVTYLIKCAAEWHHYMKDLKDDDKEWENIRAIFLILEGLFDPSRPIHPPDPEDPQNNEERSIENLIKHIEILKVSDRKTGIACIFGIMGCPFKTKPERRPIRCGCP
jgi:hypothetical protein